MQAKFTSAILVAALLLATGATSTHAQTMETFESVMGGGGVRPTTFISNGQSFSTFTNNCNTGGRFAVFVPGNFFTKCGAFSQSQDNPNTNYGAGTSCTGGVCGGASAKFLDNGVTSVNNQIYSIKTTNAALFTTKALYLFLSSDGSINPSAAGGIIFRGKVAGNVVFTYNKTTGYNTSYSVNNGFTYLDFATVGYASTNIDELEIETSSICNYMAIDNFTWGAASPLPVSLISFAAQQKNNAVAINWVVAQELKFSHYEVERSMDGKSFTAIGTVPSTGSQSTYSYHDQKYVAGVNYYRLRMVNIDGSAQYSGVVSVDAIQSQDIVKVYPNPAKDKLSITLNGNTGANFQLIDIAGRIVLSMEITTQNEEVNIADLPVGIYQYRLFNNSLGLIQQGKVSKN